MKQVIFWRKLSSQVTQAAKLQLKLEPTASNPQIVMNLQICQQFNYAANGFSIQAANQGMCCTS